MSEARNVFSEVCITCVAIGVGLVAVITLAVLVWTQFI